MPFYLNSRLDLVIGPRPGEPGRDGKTGGAD